MVNYGIYVKLTGTNKNKNIKFNLKCVYVRILNKRIASTQMTSYTQS